MTAPRAPRAAPRRRTRVIPSEHSLQVQLLKELQVRKKPDVYIFAIPNAGRRSMRQGARMKAEGLRAGVADLCIMLPAGRCCWLELKKPGRTQSTEQLGFQAWCYRLGHPYAVAKTLEEAIEIVRDWGILK